MTPTLSTGTITSLVIRTGDRIISMSSNDPWYRLLRALADLFIDGEINVEELSNGIRHDHPENYACPAARHVLSSIYLAIDEPSCLCDPYSETRCQCPPSDRRARLRELISPAPIW